MTNPSRFSIRNLTSKMLNPAPKKKSVCIHLIHVSRLIKDTSGSGESYTDSHYECAKMKRRISSKRKCLDCKLYNPLINRNDEKH